MSDKKESYLDILTGANVCDDHTKVIYHACGENYTVEYHDKESNMPIYANDICGYEGPIVVSELHYVTDLTRTLLSNKYTVVIYNNTSKEKTEYYIYYKPKES